MKDLLLTTAIISLLAAAPVVAQTTDATTGVADTATTDQVIAITPPEGYSPFDSMTLTTEDMTGASVYDPNGNVVGEISDFVLATDAAGGTTTALTTTDTMATTGAEPATDADTTTAAEDGTVVPDASEGEVAPGGTGNATDAGTDLDTTATADAPADPAATKGAPVGTEGEITHVVVDVGGFLGIGERTVALPMSELQVFRGEGSENDIRIYLPWTQAQLEALPEYEEGNPATLGAIE